MNEYILYVYIKKLSTPRLSVRIITKNTFDLDKLNLMLDSEDIIVRKMALNHIRNEMNNLPTLHEEYYSEFKMKLKYDSL